MAGLALDRPFTPSELRALMQGGRFTPSQLTGGLPPVNASQSPTAGVIDREALQNLRSAPKPPVGTTTTAVPGQPVGLGARVANGLMRAATSTAGRMAGGAGMMLYPSSLGSGTLDSPEAQRAMAANRAAENSTQVVGFEGDVPIIKGAGGQTYNTPAAVKKSMNPPVVPVPGTAAATGSGIGISDYSLGNNPHPAEPGDYSLTWNQRPAFSGQSATAQPPVPQQPSDALSKAMAANPVSSGRRLIDVAAESGQPYAPIFAGPSKQIGTRQFNSGTPFEPSQGIPAMPANNPSQPLYRPLMTGRGATSPVTVGGSDIPLYETSYYGPNGQPIATITGQNQRAGGGTLSVLSGRTPEEQAAINERVKSIDSQTAAMRDVRNANRQSQGMMTVEQEDQMNAARQQMSQLAPPPDWGRLNEQQAALMQNLKDAQNIKGWGKGRQRDDAMKAAQLGLAQVEAQRQAAGQQYAHQLGLAQNFMQNQTAQGAAQARALQDQQQWMADYGLKQQANQLTGQKNELDAAQAAQRQTLDQQRLAMEQAKAQREGRLQPPDQKYMEQFYLKNEIDPANPTKKFLPDQFTSITGIPPLPEKNPEQGKVYLSPQDGMGVIFGPNGPMKIGLEQAILFDRALKRGQGLY